MNMKHWIFFAQILLKIEATKSDSKQAILSIKYLSSKSPKISILFSSQDLVVKVLKTLKYLYWISNVAIVVTRKIALPPSLKQKRPPSLK